MSFSLKTIICGKFGMLDPTLDRCWASVVDGGPTFIKLWVNVSCLLGAYIKNMIIQDQRISRYPGNNCYQQRTHASGGGGGYIILNCCTGTNKIRKLSHLLTSRTQFGEVYRLYRPLRYESCICHFISKQIIYTTIKRR